MAEEGVGHLSPQLRTNRDSECFRGARPRAEIRGNGLVEATRRSFDAHGCEQEPMHLGQLVGDQLALAA
jgi:hypothetical protein